MISATSASAQCHLAAAAAGTRSTSALGDVSIDTHAMVAIESSAHVHPSVTAVSQPRGAIATLRDASLRASGHRS
jgi:hypothetical protein